MADGEVERGIAVCGSGVGASIRENKVAGAKAALVPRPLLRPPGRRRRSHELALPRWPHRRGRTSMGNRRNFFWPPSTARPSAICGGSAKSHCLSRVARAYLRFLFSDGWLGSSDSEPPVMNTLGAQLRFDPSHPERQFQICSNSRSDRNYVPGPLLRDEHLRHPRRRPPANEPPADRALEPLGSVCCRARLGHRSRRLQCRRRRLELFPARPCPLVRYRWNEDGIAGICDRHQYLCFLCSRFGTAAIRTLKERLFGLSGKEGNHGEDVKEYLLLRRQHADALVHEVRLSISAREFPTNALVQENGRRQSQRPRIRTRWILESSTEIATSISRSNTRSRPDDMLIRITVTNRGPEAAPIHLVADALVSQHVGLGPRPASANHYKRMVTLVSSSAHAP